ncbi:oxidoreductase, FAD/FMN dependent domain protein [Bordetella pertussis H934]|nr:oxidoreductase, FAD/FMN dependent domain protein [Bordetella pertussis H934]
MYWLTPALVLVLYICVMGVFFWLQRIHDYYAALKAAYRAAGGAGAWMVNNGYDISLAEQKLSSGQADLVAFGKPFIANPDLVARLRQGAALNEGDRDTFYGGGERGYTDYPALA